MGENLTLNKDGNSIEWTGGGYFKLLKLQRYSMKHVFCLAVTLLFLIGCSQMEFSSSSSCCSDGDCETASITDSPVGDIPVTRESEGEKPKSETWLSLFDGDEAMAGWMVPVYGGDGDVEVREGTIVIGRGEMMTGIRYEKDFPAINYEIRYEARRTQGYDFFAACTFPVKETYCTFINGGWGGGTVGLSSVNGYDASENATSSFFSFKGNTWYRFRIQVTEEMIQVWITPQDKEGNWEEEKSVVELELENRKLSTRYEMEKYKPLGFCTWSTEGQVRNIEYREMGK